jgi:hydroxymethylpyrimidine pyrophosphatase-like HAD family hydrolase
VGPSTSQLVALDIDGTVLRRDGSIPERSVAAIRKLADSGTHVVFATGRSVSSALHALAPLDLPGGWIVGANGTVIASVTHGRAIIRRAATFDPTAALTALAGDLPSSLYAVESPTGGFACSAEPPPVTKGRPLLWPQPGDCMVVRPWAELLAMRANRVIVSDSTALATDFFASIDKAGLTDVEYAIGWSPYVDIVPKGASKGMALEWVRERLHVPLRATMAIGDGWNDVEMFAWAACSVAMGNAPFGVQELADEVTGPVDEDGLAEALETRCMVLVGAR